MNMDPSLREALIDSRDEVGEHTERRRVNGTDSDLMEVLTRDRLGSKARAVDVPKDVDTPLIEDHPGVCELHTAG